jgi:4-hydroxybenzoate polyprenyltransferase
MATAVRGLSALRAFLEMIKFEHSIFALPFAFIGMIWAGGWPGWRVFLLITLAMVAARTAAMTFNRIVDREIDALNPRTQLRALPAGILQLRQANLYLLISCAIFLAAARLLNPLAFALSPIALGITMFYSYTKRFTPLCHFFLGLAMGVAPAASFIASSGKLHPVILPITFAVLFWGAGFDILYAMQDVDFDESHHLRSLPQTLGLPKALLVSRVSHVLCVGLLAYGGFLVGAGLIYFIGVGCVAALLAYEQNLVRPNDLSKVNLAFFTLNGFVSIGLFAFVVLDRLLSPK